MMEKREAENLRPLVNQASWDQLIVHFTNRRAEAHQRLETCPIDSLRGIQGELKEINYLLTIRETINTIANMAVSSNPGSPARFK